MPSLLAAAEVPPDRELRGGRGMQCSWLAAGRAGPCTPAAASLLPHLPLQPSRCSHQTCGLPFWCSHLCWPKVCNKSVRHSESSLSVNTKTAPVQAVPQTSEPMTCPVIVIFLVLFYFSNTSTLICLNILPALTNSAADAVKMSIVLVFCLCLKLDTSRSLFTHVLALLCSLKNRASATHFCHCHDNWRIGEGSQRLDIRPALVRCGHYNAAQKGKKWFDEHCKHPCSHGWAWGSCLKG